ncbi:unnamed protein product [Choristocarpus tenellus]
MTALHRAASVGRKHMCIFLVLAGASKDERDRQGRRPEDVCRGVHPRAFEVIRQYVPQEEPLKVCDARHVLW